MAVKKYVANENESANITKGLDTADISLKRVSKSVEVRPVVSGDTVYFRRPDGIQGKGRVLEVGKSGELLVMEKAVLPSEEDGEKYIPAGQYYRSKADSLTKAKAEPEAEPIYPEVKAGQEVGYKDAEGGTKHAKVNRLSTGGHIIVKDGDKELKLDPSAYWLVGEGQAYMDWEASFSKAKKERKEKPKVAKKKLRSMAAEHIGKHKQKYGMDQKQAVATWLSEARRKGIINYPKGDADFEAYIPRSHQLPAPIKNPGASTQAGKEGRKIWPQDADLDGTTGAPVPVRSSGGVSGYKWPKNDADLNSKEGKSHDEAKDKDLDVESKKMQGFMHRKVGKLRKEGKPEKHAVAEALSIARKRGYKVPPKKDSNAGYKADAKKEASARSTKVAKSGKKQGGKSEGLEKALNVLTAKVAKNLRILGEKKPDAVLAWVRKAMSDKKMAKSFTSKKKEDAWKRAVARGKKRSKPHKLDKSKKKVNKAQATVEPRSGPLKGSPAYDKWITTFRLHHPQVFRDLSRGGQANLKKLQHASAKRLEDIMKQDVPYKEKLRRIRQYVGAGGVKGVAGVSSAKKMDKSKEVKDKKASGKEIALPSQAEDQKEMSDRKMPVSEMPQRSR